MIPENALSTSLAAPYVAASPHLYAVMLLAKHDSGGDATLVSAIATDEVSALNGAREQNMKFHPEPEWSEHQELSFMVPDQLILQMADILRGQAPGMTRQQDPFAGISSDAPVAAPAMPPAPFLETSPVGTVLSMGGPQTLQATPSPPIPEGDDICVSYPPGSEQFNFQKP